MEPNDFEQLLSEYSTLKKNHVDPRLEFYEQRVESKRHAAERSKAAILLLSLIIPVVANLDFPPPWKGSVVSVLSLLIAFISGFGELHQWQQTWHQYSQAIVQIKGLIGSWELEIVRARQLTDLNKIKDTLEQATTDLLKSVEKVVLAEMGGFFAAATKTAPAQGQPGEQTAAK